MMPTSELVDPAVRAFVEALNANDPAAVLAALSENATMTMTVRRANWVCGSTAKPSTRTAGWT